MNVLLTYKHQLKCERIIYLKLRGALHWDLFQQTKAKVPIKHKTTGMMVQAITIFSLSFSGCTVVVEGDVVVVLLLP